MEKVIRDQVRQRAGGVCEYCHMPEQWDELEFQIDHIIARKHHGTDEPDNLA
jgi:5-methylcytosine-specific restriction endonuclease McrA